MTAPNTKKKTISKRKFAILEAQRNELKKEFDEPVFIDIEAEKLYIINEDWYKQFIF